MTLRAGDFFSGESQFVVVEPRTPQPLFPLHEHDFHEIVIVASGNGWHVLNDEPHLLSCGEVLYLQSTDRHAFDEVHDHLVRELAISLAPRIRVNGVSPATVITGSTMFPRDRVITSLQKYGIRFEPEASDESLEALLADFYASRALTLQAVHPDDCARPCCSSPGPRRAARQVISFPSTAG